MVLPAPLVLGSTHTITRGVATRFNAADLAPKVSVPYEVSAIRILAYPSLNATGESGIAPDSSLRGFLKFKFDLGNIPLTDNYIPLWNLAPTRQLITELGGYFKWTFRRPLLISPAAQITAQMQLASNTPNAGASPTITTTIAYEGRLRPDLDTMPAMIDVPFCSCWDSSLTGTHLSNDGASLWNPLEKSIDVDMLICRIENDSTGLNGDDSTELQIYDPYGRSMRRDGSIQIHAMFPNDTHVFPYSGKLDPGQRFHVRLNTAPSATYRPMISYLGSRRERSL